MSLKKVAITDVKNIKNIVLKDILVNDEGSHISLEDICDYAEANEINYIDSQNISRYLSLSIDDAPYCCGVKEIGQLEKIEFISQKAFNYLVKGLLLSNYTFIINTNGEKASLSWDEKLEKCKMFTCIKEFKNPSSENIIKVWVSNHLK